jgi:predicted nucleotidyltransferase component of viral defense system
VSQHNPPNNRVHEDVDLFREAVNFTTSETGFIARLIEKDYFCTLLLGHLAAARHAVVKGGACLAKVHADFYRLSEDLDFAVSVPTDANRSVRRKLTTSSSTRVKPPGFKNEQPSAIADRISSVYFYLIMAHVNTKTNNTFL